MFIQKILESMNKRYICYKYNLDIEGEDCKSIQIDILVKGVLDIYLIQVIYLFKIQIFFFFQVNRDCLRKSLFNIKFKGKIKLKIRIFKLVNNNRWCEMKICFYLGLYFLNLFYLLFEIYYVYEQI